MSTSHRRWPWVSAGLVVCALVVSGLVGGRLLADRAARQTLRDRGLRWTSVDVGPTQTVWHELEGPGLQISQARWSLWPHQQLDLSAVDVQLEPMLSQLLPSPHQGSPSRLDGLLPASVVPPVQVHGLSLRAGDLLLVSDLSGSLWPTQELTGTDSTLRRAGDDWQLSASRQLSLGPASASLQLDAHPQGPLVSLSLSSTDLVLSHPGLAPAPLPPMRLTLAGLWDPTTHDLQAKGQLGEVSLQVSGTVQAAPSAAATSGDPSLPIEADLKLSVDGELTQIMAIFGALLPETQRAQCSGSLGLDLDLEVHSPPPASPARPRMTWAAQAHAKDLHCSGLLTNVSALKSGRVTWRAQSADGSPFIARVGPDRPGFTSWPQGRAIAQAIVASEDIHFLQHPGYDLDAINEALAQAASGDARPRGGSTLTQQLAKNLFLSADRTLLRKLRELVYALCLEDALDKRHIMQLYLNVVELGPDLHGVGPAAEAYFAKSPAGLTDREAAFIATLLPAPKTGFQRATTGRYSRTAIDRVLDNLEHTGMRTHEQIARARRQPLVLLVSPPGTAASGPAAEPYPLRP